MLTNEMAPQTGGSRGRTIVKVENGGEGVRTGRNSRGGRDRRTSDASALLETSEGEIEDFAADVVDCGRGGASAASKEGEEGEEEDETTHSTHRDSQPFP